MVHFFKYSRFVKHVLEQIQMAKYAAFPNNASPEILKKKIASIAMKT